MLYVTVIIFLDECLYVNILNAILLWVGSSLKFPSGFPFSLQTTLRSFLSRVASHCFLLWHHNTTFIGKPCNNTKLCTESMGLALLPRFLLDESPIPAESSARKREQEILVLLQCVGVSDPKTQQQTPESVASSSHRPLCL